MAKTMEWFQIEVEACTRGTVYIEAPDEATARLMIEHATLEQAMRGQVLHEAIKEKVSFNPLSIIQQTCGIDYNDPGCEHDCSGCQFAYVSFGGNVPDPE